MKENEFQSELIDELYSRFPESVILKNDAGYIIGIPDLTILLGNKWALLECKKSQNAPHQPNQDYYISWASEVSFGAFIYPENCEEVLYELEQFMLA